MKTITAYCQKCFQALESAAIGEKVLCPVCGVYSTVREDPLRSMVEASIDPSRPPIANALSILQVKPELIAEACETPLETVERWMSGEEPIPLEEHFILLFLGEGVARRLEETLFANSPDLHSKCLAARQLAFARTFLYDIDDVFERPEPDRVWAFQQAKKRLQRPEQKRQTVNVGEVYPTHSILN